MNKINTGHNGFVLDYCKSMEDVIGSYEKAFNSSLFSRDYTKECMYIAEYNLNDWKNAKYMGGDIDKICTTSYEGVVECIMRRDVKLDDADGE